MNDRLTVFGTTLQRPRAMNPPPVPGSGPSPLLATGVVLTLLVAALMVYQPPTDGPTGLTTVQSDFLQGLVADQGRSSPQLLAYDSCFALEEDLKEHIKDEMRATLASNQGGYYRGGWGGGWMEDDGMFDDAEMATDAGSVATSAADSSGAASQGATGSGGAASGEREFSGTNNQEGGVDEADFVKTDGDYLYLLFGDQYYYYSLDYRNYLNGGRLHILAVPEVGEVEYLSNATVEGWPREMLLSGDRMAVYSDISVWDLVYSKEEHPLLPYLLRQSVVTANESGGSWTNGSAPDASGFVADSASYSSDSFRVNSLSKLTVFDLGDRTAPQVERALYMEGWYQTAREVDGTVRMVSQGYLDIPGLVYWPELPDEHWNIYWEDENGIRDDVVQQKRAEQLWMEAINATIAQNEAIIDATDLDELIPRIYELQDGNVTIHSFTDAADCQDFVIAKDGTSSSVTSIMTLDLNSDDLTFEADHVMSNWATIYASANMLVIAEMANDWWWFWDDEAADYQEATNLHAFDISQPGQTSYIGSGRVNGTILDQFSLSEHNGYLRVATTTGQWGRWWISAEEQSGPENHVFVLEQVIHAAGSTAQSTELNVVGHVGGIAVGERIWSSRFVGDRGYLVTFRNIDPLWTLDLSDPANPQVIGELEVPGVSTYIHPLDEDYLLTIGIAGDENGLDWGSTQLSLFDVSDFANPVLASKLELSPVPEDEMYGWNWARSEATYEHKAFQYWNGQLAIPLSTFRYTLDESGYGHYEYVSKLVLVDVSTTDGLSIYDSASIDHSMFYEMDNNMWNHFDIRRTVFIDGYVYAISQQGVTVHKLDTMALSDYAGLPVSQPHYEPREEKVDGSDPDGNSQSGDDRATGSDGSD